ncbi:MAG: NAD-dependent epimerase/dehydratase family protein [Actinomycetes bacterium]
MRLLVMGGTQFVGRHIAEIAIERGHQVTVFHRGRSNADAVPEAEHIIGDRDTDLERLGGHEWDATVDVSAYVPRQVTELAQALGGRGGRHAFVSTVSVYAEPAPSNCTEDAPLIELPEPTTEVVDGETYGGLKVLCERAIAQHYADAIVIRPTYVVGPYDYTHRFTYWINRIADGGRVVAPDIPGYGIQVIDARDQARWILELLEQADAGTFHTVSPPPPFTYADMLQTLVDAIGPDGTEIVPVTPQFLIDQSVGNADLPLWYPSPDPDAGLNCDPARAKARGFATRSLADTVVQTLAHERATPTPNPDGIGWSRDREAAVLATWDAHQT